jgi:hypothetical protein
MQFLNTKLIKNTYKYNIDAIQDKIYNNFFNLCYIYNIYNYLCSQF